MQTRRRRQFAPQTDEAAEPRACDVPNCPNHGEYRAPRSRDNLRDYYWFCLEHVQAYNKSWNYMDGLTDQEMERLLRSDTVWQRPTWPMGAAGMRREDLMRSRIYREFGLGGGANHREDLNDGNQRTDSDAKAGGHAHSASRAADRALAVLDLSWPVDFATIKARYRTLAKRHHPDANNGSREAEEVLKSINEAYAILRANFAP